MSDYFATTGETLLADGDDLTVLVDLARASVQGTGADAAVWRFTRELAAVVFTDGSVIWFVRPSLCLRPSQGESIMAIPDAAPSDLARQLRYMTKELRELAHWLRWQTTQNADVLAADRDAVLLGALLPIVAAATRRLASRLDAPPTPKPRKRQTSNKETRR